MDYKNTKKPFLLCCLFVYWIRMSNIHRLLLMKKAATIPSSGYDPIPFELWEEHSVEIAPSSSTTTTTTTTTKHVFKLYTLNESTDGRKLLLVFLHGGGLSSMSWAPCIQMMYESDTGKDFEYCAMDFRGHGQTRTSNDSDLHVNTLVNDTVTVLNRFYVENGEETGRLSNKRDVILIGHSLGGAIACKCIPLLKETFNVRGMIIVDIVEGTAVSNLEYMKKILANRPHSFPSVQHAIKWTVDSAIVKNQMSARVSLPSQLVKNEQTNQYVWRTELEKSEQYWKEWFQGLSDAFLSADIPKMLLVANTDRLDNSLLIASMQGKFQFKVLRGEHIGHFIHEDDPKQTSQVLLSFCNRFK
jgi:protein phosphatase methylesterase 1